jgi:hypothetical protein
MEVASPEPIEGRNRVGVYLARLLTISPAHASTPTLEPVEVSARLITQFRIGSTETRFGSLEFVGGLEMTSSSRDFGGFSSLRFTAPGSAFVGVADTGFWFFGGIARDSRGVPSGIENFRMAPILDADGMPLSEKRNADAEGIALDNGGAIVSFEREHRIARYRFPAKGVPELVGTLDFLVPRHELRSNAGFETIAVAPPDGPLAGAPVAISEKSLDAQGNIFAAVLDGPRKGVFTVLRSGYDVTDGAFLPNGDLLLLERHYAVLSGVSMRLRRIPADLIGEGKLADGAVLLEADMGYQIDNMEGLDVWRRDDGALMVSLISDDNTSILQRNLYLEFRLMEERSTGQ